ncbi:hypothetical protein, partial [Auraticoccus cholistanensis]|uniref:hypothetical protein n=1 Tax=Auraticoccus cholistanensis TaxID=2656650 RepID=UPI0018D20B44
ARALFEGDESEQAARLAMTLAGDPLAVSAPRLQVEALLLASRASRSASDLGLAVERGERALSLTGLVDDADLEAEARVVLLGALMEADQVERAEEVAEGLQRRLRRIGSPQVTGLAHWTLGNMAWLSGAAEEGARHHAEAARLLNPHVDLRNWGRFRKAAAVVRLQNGVVDDVLELLHQAGDALRIVGNPSDLTELRLAEARYWLLSGETRTARSLVEYSLDDTTLAEAPHSRAEAEQLLGEIEVAEGHQRAAGQAFLRAALLFEQAGAYKRSVQMWRRHAG